MAINKVIIVGNLGRDPEVRQMQSGDHVASLAVATTESWKDKQTGEKREQTEWHSVSFFGRLAEVASEYLHKGSQVYIEGKLRTRKYTDKDGIERFATEIIGDVMQMLGSRQGEREGTQQRAPADKSAQPQRNAYADAKGRPAQQPRPSLADMDDDIPF